MKRDRRMFRMSKEELETFLQSRRNRTFAKKKGRGSYTRKKKHEDRIEGFRAFFFSFRGFIAVPANRFDVPSLVLSGRLTGRFQVTFRASFRQPFCLLAKG